jgi:AhpD family alkylhydroperoxidase
MMKKLQVFDPALCCSTGVCGVDVDPALVNFSADVDWAKQNGAQIERFNLAQQPLVFAESVIVKNCLEKDGQEGLPLFLVDGALVLSGRYPSRDELIKWLGITTAPSLFTEQVAELVAIGAAIGANCEPCFKYHYDQARKLGVSNLDMRYAVDLAQKVKDTPARNMLDLAARYLGPATPDTTGKAGACCVTAPVAIVKPASKCCG